VNGKIRSHSHETRTYEDVIRTRAHETGTRSWEKERIHGELANESKGTNFTRSRGGRGASSLRVSAWTVPCLSAPSSRRSRPKTLAPVFRRGHTWSPRFREPAWAGERSVRAIPCRPLKRAGNWGDVGFPPP